MNTLQLKRHILATSNAPFAAATSGAHPLLNDLLPIMEYGQASHSTSSFIDPVFQPQTRQEVDFHLRALLEGLFFRYSPFATMEEVGDMIAGYFDESSELPLLKKLRNNKLLLRHSIIVAALSGLLLKFLNAESSIVQSMVLAGLLHDVGHLSTSSITQRTKNPELAKYHIAVFQEVVTTQYPGIDPICAVSVAHHHEYLDGTGYPRQLSGDDISFWGRILALTNYIGGHYSFRPQVSGDLERLMDDLIEHQEHWFDPNITAMFFNMVELVPKQCEVLLLHNGEKKIGYSGSRLSHVVTVDGRPLIIQAQGDERVDLLAVGKMEGGKSRYRQS